MKLNIIKKIDAASPVMVAGWPGMGSVAMEVVDYLRKKLDAARWAEIVADRNAIADAVAVKEGLAVMPEAPRYTFYYKKEADLIIFEGEAQLPGQDGVELLQKVLDVAIEYRVKSIFTGAAFPLPVSHKEPSAVYGAVNRASLKDVIKKHGVKIMEDGHISGLNGLLLGYAGSRGIDAFCLLATMPQYAISIPNPKASLAVIEALGGILNLVIDTGELSDYAKEMDERMALIEEKVKDAFVIDEDKAHFAPPLPPSSGDKKIPPYIIDKIEKLFKEARQDKSKAALLKKELDRWDLYKAYEDKFLDLFKENQ